MIFSVLLAGSEVELDSVNLLIAEIIVLSTTHSH